MKKNFVSLFLGLCIILPGLVTPLYGQWKKYVIDDDIGTTVSVDTADLDGDSRLDLVVTGYGDNTLVWYQNNYPSWIKHIIDANASGVTFAYCGDMDGDDTIDVVANLYRSKKIILYENNHPTWTNHYIDQNTDDADFIAISDINIDGRPDVVAMGSFVNGGDVVWYENKHPEWVEHIIESGSEKYPSMTISDIDGNGLPDIAATMNDSNKVVWFKNEDNGLLWTKYTIGENLVTAFGLNSGDIDGDDEIDIVATTGGPYFDGSEVVWYEQQNLSWTEHIIDTDLQGADWPIFTDIDRDDTMDVVVSGYEANSIVWYENNHPSWTKHVIDDNIRGPRLILSMDVDGDLLEDIITCAENCVVWHRNPGNTAYATSFEVSPYSIQSTDDTLTISAWLHNPDNHPMNVFSVIEGEQSEFIDTLPLFDDGMHGDGDLSDHAWANIKEMTGFPEDVYNVDLVAYDSTTGNSYDYVPPERFITFGPLNFEDYTITPPHQVFSPLEIIEFTLTLRNNSTTAVATNIQAQLQCFDPNVAVSGSHVSFGNIAPGESSISDGSFQIRIFNTNLENTYLPVTVNIYHEYQKCWIDTLSIFVYDAQPVNIPDTAFLFALIEEGVDTNGDSLISYEEAEATISLWVHNREISDLTGIEAFTNLDTLSCQGNLLTNLDISNITELVALGCGENQLTDLDVSNNTSLTLLACAHNQLSTLDISNNTALEVLFCGWNQFEGLDISNCTALKNISIGGMTMLREVCVWESFHPDSLIVDTTGSPDVCFETDCNGVCDDTGVGSHFESGISIYPNPAEGIISIESASVVQFSVEMHSINGQLIYYREVEGTTYLLDLSSYRKGVYFITIRTEDFVTTRKIVKL